MTRRQLLVALLVTIPLAACQRQRELSPPQVRYGRDTCAECGMILSDARFAAAAATADGETVLFDDIGCLLIYRQKQSPSWAAIWVHDLDTQSWLQAENAWYLVSQGIRSPMGYGIAAFASQDAAQRRQTELGGDLFHWNELLARPPARPRQH
ncbi:MAG: nitrous oxide reductase accessory protein NosL [Thermomicrobium sp.]